MKKMLAIAALLSAPVLAQASPNLVINGSFEDYAVAAGSWSIFSGSNGWTAGDLGLEVRNGVAGTAADGFKFVELDTTGNSWISQTILTNANQALELSFSYAPREGVSAGSNGIQAFWNGVSLGAFTAKGNKNNGWMDLTFDVQADVSGLGNLTFRAIGVADSYGGSLDNVSVTAVPEPDSAALLIAGLGVLAAVARRRKAA